MSRFPLLTFLTLSFAIPAISQTTQASCSGVANSGTQSIAITRTGVATPYSLTAIIKTEMKLSDGNTISGSATSRQARDGQGRTRVESPSVCATDKDHETRWQGSIQVTDPVARTSTFWGEWRVQSKKIATITHSPSIKISTPQSSQDEYRAAQQVSQAYDHVTSGVIHDSQQVEDLGKRNIAGLAASGMRITRTSPAGMVGNLRPLTYVEEKWESDEYRMILLDIKDDPVFGSSTYEVTNFNRDEPDPSLFQPPVGYEITERTLTQ